MIAIVVAMSENRVIGRDNQLPWHLPADLRHFKKITMGHPLVMGRKTYESIGKPLPGRPNIIVTTQKDYKAENCLIASSIEAAIETAKELDEEVYVIGGAEIFKQTMPLVDTIHLTLVQTQVEGDVYFPELNPQEWQEAGREEHAKDVKHPYAFAFVRLVRRD